MRGTSSGRESLCDDSRAGFTLVELLIAAVIATIVLAAVYQVLVTNQRVSIVQQEQVAGHQTVRAGVDLLAQELREVSARGGDLLVIDPVRVAFRAFRAYGLTCEIDVVGGDAQLTVMRVGGRFANGDSIYLFADDSPETAADDAWIRIDVREPVEAASCDVAGESEAADRFRVPALSDLQRLRVRRGAPVRAFEHVEYALGIWEGLPYVVRRVGNEAAVPLVGPVRAGSGVAFQYLDANGNPTGTATQVARVRIMLRTVSGALTQDGRAVADSLTTTVHLRN